MLCCYRKGRTKPADFSRVSLSERCSETVENGRVMTCRSQRQKPRRHTRRDTPKQNLNQSAVASWENRWTDHRVREQACGRKFGRLAGVPTCEPVLPCLDSIGVCLPCWANHPPRSGFSRSATEGEIDDGHGQGANSSGSDEHSFAACRTLYRTKKIGDLDSSADARMPISAVFKLRFFSPPENIG